MNLLQYLANKVQDLLKVLTVGTVIIGFLLFNDNDKTSEYQEAGNSFGKLWKEHQQLP